MSVTSIKVSEFNVVIRGLFSVEIKVHMEKKHSRMDRKTPKKTKLLGELALSSIRTYFKASD